MTNDLAGMVCLACGTERKLRILGVVLRRFSIASIVIEPNSDDLFTPIGKTELWVDQWDADRARGELLKNRAANRGFVYGAEVY